jgi:flavin-dependent dehydrogenase
VSAYDLIIIGGGAAGSMHAYPTLSELMRTALGQAAGWAVE